MSAQNTALLEPETAELPEQIVAEKPPVEAPPAPPAAPEKEVQQTALITPPAPEQKAPAAEEVPPAAAQNPMVINLAAFRKRLSEAEAIDNTGVFDGVDPIARGQASLLKRVVRALFRKDTLSDPESDHELRALQSEYTGKLSTSNPEAMAAAGEFGKAVKRYLKILIKQNNATLVHLEHDKLQGDEASPLNLIELENKARDNLKKYGDELKCYEQDASFIDQAVRDHPDVIKQQKNLPYETIAARVIAGGDAEKLAFYSDLTSDVSCVQATRTVLALLKDMPDQETLNRYREDPALNDARIQAAAVRISKATQTLGMATEFEAPTPEAGAIYAAKDLLAAELRQASTQLRTREQMVNLETEAQKMTKEYAQAMLSLTLNYLRTGAAQNDTRAVALAKNLEQEAQLLGIQPITDPKEANKKMANLARVSAEDLLSSSPNDKAMTARITALANSAGVKTKMDPLQAKPVLIGVSAEESIKKIIDDPHTLVSNQVVQALNKVINKSDGGVTAQMAI